MKLMSIRLIVQHAACVFYLHNKCAEAPAEMDHPFHPNHCFTLLQSKPYNYRGDCQCDFCGETCEHFVYHCSCGLDLHIKCALLSYDIANKRVGELHHIARIDPLISTETHGKALKEAKCFACWKPLLDSEYLSIGSGFYLHVKCVDSLLQINHLLHSEHPLLLQFNNQRLPCDVCQETQRIGLVYCCQPCKFVLHIGCAAIPAEIHHFSHRKHHLILKFNREAFTCQICFEKTKGKSVYCCSTCEFAIHNECASPPPSIEHKNHPHPFQLFKRRSSYTCDACGTQGNHVSYACLECCIMVHKKCISLPRAIKFYRHYHPLSHNYFLENGELEMPGCGLCRNLVKSEHGSYFCSKCNYIVHVNCILERGHYHEVDPTKMVDETMYIAPYSRVTDTSIKHFSHHHNLEFSEDIKDVDKQCDGCCLFISTSFYYCLQCDFCLHKSCAELSMKMHILFHFHQALLKLRSGDIFECSMCRYLTSGFGYHCNQCTSIFCLRCALVSDIPTCEGHEHPLPFYSVKTDGMCNACGINFRGSSSYSCRTCNFNLDILCLQLPLVVRHRSDVHLLRLTYGDKINYSEYLYCDICEEKRNPNYWFYYCTICDNSVHTECAINEYSFIKSGSIYKKRDHPHPLTFVQKVHYYPKCHKCDKPCLHGAFECKTIGCSYVVHWKCVPRANLFNR